MILAANLNLFSAREYRYYMEQGYCRLPIICLESLHDDMEYSMYQHDNQPKHHKPFDQ